MEENKVVSIEELRKDETVLIKDGRECKEGVIRMLDSQLDKLVDSIDACPEAYGPELGTIAYIGVAVVDAFVQDHENDAFGDYLKTFDHDFELRLIRDQIKESDEYKELIDFLRGIRDGIRNEMTKNE